MGVTNAPGVHCVRVHHRYCMWEFRNQPIEEDSLFPSLIIQHKYILLGGMAERVQLLLQLWQFTAVQSQSCPKLILGYRAGWTNYTNCSQLGPLYLRGSHTMVIYSSFVNHFTKTDMGFETGERIQMSG